MLDEAGDVILADLDRESLHSQAAMSDVLWVRLRHRIDEALIQRAPRLRVLVTPTTGLNHIDTEALSRGGIHLISLRGEIDFLRDVRATAEHTIGLILALLRRIPQAAAGVRAGNWNRDAFKGSELYGKTVGVVGYGRLGQIVARYLRAFDTRVLVTDRKIGPGPVAPDINAVALDQLLAESDLVTIHVDLREDTFGFFSAPQFDRMKWGSHFINTSRGELIDEGALLENLRSGRIASAALDVLCHENSEGMPDHPLIQFACAHENLLITPHIGGCTRESMHKAECFLAEKLAGFLHEKGFAGTGQVRLEETSAR